MVFGPVHIYFIKPKLHLSLKIVEHSWNRAAKIADKEIIYRFYINIINGAQEIQSAKKINSIYHDSKNLFEKIKTGYLDYSEPNDDPEIKGIR